MFDRNVAASYHRIDDAARDLRKFCETFRAARLTFENFEPTAQDARDFQGDLLNLAKHVDNFVLAYGQMLREYGFITDKQVQECFHEQLLKALDGNALFHIEEGIRQRCEDRAYA